MALLKQIALVAVATCSGLFLAGCQPSDPSSPKVAGLSSIAVSPSAVSLDVGSMQSLTVIGTFTDGTTRDVSFDSTFASSASTVATVSATGLVSGVAAGTATITATHTGSGETATTEVTVAPLRVISIAVTPAAVVLSPGGTQQLLVNGHYDNATNGDVTADSTFVSSDPSVATVDASGLVRAVAEGPATITVTHTASAATATATVEVTNAVFSGIDFDDPGVVYTLTGFGGAEDSTLVPDPTDATNTVAKVVKAATAESWAGTTVSTGPNASVGRMPFTATDTRMRVRVYSPRVGVVVLLKVEDAADGDRYVETEAVTTVADGWETLTFDFANPTATSPALNPAYTYNKISIFFDFGKSGADGGGGTFYFDDVTFVGGGGESGDTGTCAAPNCTDFSADGIVFAPFENQGGGTVELASDPNDAGNAVVKFVKRVGDGEFFGTTIAGLAGPAELTAANRTVTLRVYSPAAGTNFLFKLEGGPGGAIVEKDVATTVAGAWETLSFDLSAGPAGTYATVVIFPYGRSTVTAETTMYIDELRFPAALTGGTPLVFASGYASNSRTVEGGEWGFYSGNFTDYANTYAGGDYVDQGILPENSYVYLVVTTSAPTTGGFMGIFTAAPGSTIAAPNAGVTLDGQTTLKLEIALGEPWLQQPGNKALTVILKGAEVYSNGGGDTCRIDLTAPLTPTTAEIATYTIELASMTLAQPCNGGGFNSGVTTVAEALTKPIGEIHVQAVYPQVNTTVLAGAEYPTGYTRGATWFE